MLLALKWPNVTVPQQLYLEYIKAVKGGQAVGSKLDCVEND